MYAIMFDLNPDALAKIYGSPTYINAYNDIKKVLNSLGFTRIHRSLFFGDEQMDAARCVLAVQELVRTYPWFAGGIASIKMLRISEVSDLKPAMDY